MSVERKTLKPLVPKIRVGDVLYGTKNLRNYLRVCSLVRYLKVLDRPRSIRKPIEIYTPRKDDRFLVVVNTPELFCVWGENLDVMLRFSNGSSEYPDKENIRMNPTLFTRWFINTRERNPDVLKWPLHVYHTWAWFQMEASKNRETPIVSSPIRGPSERVEGDPFLLRDHMESITRRTDQATVRQAVREAATNKAYRYPQPVGGHDIPGLGLSQTGPALKRSVVTTRPLGPCFRDRDRLLLELSTLTRKTELMPVPSE
jgi:hypothetical protein